MRTVIKMVSSGLYVGYAPVAPGTVGSIWGMLIYLQLRDYPSLYILMVVLLFVLGFSICAKAEEIFGKKDSPRIVIDEIASMGLVYLFIRPTWFMIILGFILFRIFDIIKPPPARKMQELPGSKGVMLDDLVAACYTIIMLFVLGKVMAFCPVLGQEKSSLRSDVFF